MFSVMTFNLRFGFAPDKSERSWEYRKQVFPDLFEYCDTDIIAFQEVNDFQKDFLREVLDDYELIGTRSPAPEFWQNNLIFYKKGWKCLKHGRFFLTHLFDTPSRYKESKWPRQFSFGEFDYYGRKLACINTHFDFDPQIQARSAKLLLSWIDKNIAKDIPIILMGDFNASPDSSKCYELFTEPLDNGSEFEDAFSPPFPASFHNFSGNTDGEHIDWILYRGDLYLKGSKAIQVPIGGIWPSDHFPMCAEFDWIDSDTIIKPFLF